MVIDITDPFLHPDLARTGRTRFIRQVICRCWRTRTTNRTDLKRYLEMLLDRRVEGLVVIANWLVTDIKLLADLTECQVRR